MCGIAGTVGIGDRSTVEKMTAILAHRGPDDAGTYEDGEACLGHRRLAILDLTSAGHQPMESGDGRLIITYNGEIYNFRQLRSDLEKRGHRFHTATDTEVVLCAYREFGLDCLSRLEGMFAFALWDRRKRELLLARDRTGIKPLYYFAVSGGIAFASELKAMLHVPGVQRKPNLRAVRSAIRYACNLDDESALASVYKLPPGSWLRWSDGVIERGRYWSFPSPSAEQRSERQLTAGLRSKLEEVVASHMVADAPLGATLSGGIDSSGIVALMSRQTGGAVKTFAIGHGDDDPDLLAARIVAKHCSTDHHEIRITAGDIASLLPTVIWHLEEPLGQMESLQMFAIYREAAKFVKVLLIGEGADELFAGYRRYRLLQPNLPIPRRMRQQLYERVYMYADAPPKSFGARALAHGMWGRPATSPLADPSPYEPSPLDGLNGSGLTLESALDRDRRGYLHQLSLKRADAMGMANSVELRVPYVDHRLVEFAARIPGSMLLHNGTDKYILRRAFEPLLPKSIVWRAKRPIQMRLNLGLAETLDQLCDRLLPSDRVRERGFFEPAKVDALRRGRPGRFTSPMAHSVWSYRVWSMLLCEVWARVFLDAPLAADAAETLALII